MSAQAITTKATGEASIAERSFTVEFRHTNGNGVLMISNVTRAQSEALRLAVPGIVEALDKAMKAE